MAKPELGFGSIQLGVTPGPAEATPVPEQTPFRILLLADFSGRAARSVVESGTGLAGRRPVRVDRDNLEEVMAKLGVELPQTVFGLHGPALRFRELDDFLPDRLYAQLDVFQSLRETRQRLQDPSTFVAAAAEVRGLVEQVGSTTEPTETAPPTTAASSLSPEDLLAQMLGEPVEGTSSPPPAAQPTSGGLDLPTILQTIVRPYLLPGADPREKELVAAVDAATTGQMRTLLHHPVFQEVEAAWRAAHFVVRKLDTDHQLQVYLLDVSRAELAADLDAVENLRDSGTYRLLVEQTLGTPGAPLWAVVAGHYTFDQNRADVEFLGRLAKIVARAGAPFLAGASPHVVGCDSFGATPDPNDWNRRADPEGSAAWQVLRQLPEASSLGLALPRFILRLPYGKAGTPTEAFAFEELPEHPEHEHFLWGNPAFASVYLLGEAFSRYGWGLKPGAVRDIGGLPLPIYEEDGEKQIKPCAEALLTDRAASVILNQGLMPLLSIKDSDGVSLVSFQSLADPAAPVRGRWGTAS
jgi:type VI secretion system protein ImpC